MRTLYDCAYARVRGTRVYCEKRHPIATQTGNSFIDLSLLARGRRLAMAFCQKCADFDSMGSPLPADEKGWIDKSDLEVG
jgi:hypothetical protein